MERIIIERPIFNTSIRLEVTLIGDDYLIAVSGGTKPHIGCAALAAPRPSISDSRRCSATSSVLNQPGHKDESICRYLAERVASSTQAVAACAGGFHVDNLLPGQIESILKLVEEMADELVNMLR